MRPIANFDNAQIAKNNEDFYSRQESHTFSATPDIADRLGKAATAYNWVNPAIIASFVLSGNDAALEQVAQKAAMDAWKNGVTPTTVRPSAVSPQERRAAMQRAIAKANAASAAMNRPVPTPSRRTTPKAPKFAPAAMDFAPYGPAAMPEQEGTGGGRGMLGMITPVGNQIDWLKHVYDYGKAAGKGFLAGFAYIPQVAINEIAALANYLPAGHSFRTQRDKNLFDQFIRGPLVEETFFGQMVTQGAKATVTKGAPSAQEILGKGLLSGGLVAEEQAKAAREYRPLIGTGENVHAFTLGRAGAQSLADVGVIEEGSLAFNLLSGTIDFGVALTTDPSFGAGAGRRPFGSGGFAGSALAEADALKLEAGLANGTRPTVVPTMWNKAKNTPKLVRRLVPFVEEKNPAQVWRMLRRQGLLSADEIAQATDHAGVVKAIDNAVQNLAPAYEIRETPAGTFDVVSNLGYRLKQSAQRYTKLFEVVPESTYIPRTDPQLAALRIDDTMGYLGFSIDERNLWINKFIEVAKDGTSESFFNYLSDWESNLLKPALEGQLVPKGDVSRITRWKRETFDRASRFTLQDIQNGTHYSWMEAGNMGPLRNTQLLQDGAWIIDATEIDDVSKKLGKLYKLEREAENVPVIGSVTQKAREGADVIDSAMGWFYPIWKSMVVAKATYLMRVLPIEQARVYLNGTFDSPAAYIGAIMDGRFAAKLGADGKYAADIFGEVINKSKLAVDLDHQIIQIRQVENEIARLQSAKLFDEADELTRLYADELDSIDDLVLQKERAEQALNELTPTLNDALIGRIPGEARRRILGEAASGVYNRTGDYVTQSRLTKKELPFWARGVAQEVADLHNNPHIRRVANGGLFPKDELIIDGVRATVTEHLDAGRFLGGDEAIAQWLHSGSGRQYFTKYYENYAGIPDGYDWDNIETAREFVAGLNREVESVAGGNLKMLQAIVDGTFDDVPAFTRDKVFNRVDTDNKEFLRYIRDEFSQDPTAPTHIQYRPSGRGAGSFAPGSQVRSAWDGVMDLFFKGMYGTASDKLARSPAFRAAYWGRVEEVAHLATPEAAKDLLNNLDAANLPRPQADRIRRLLKMADGTNDLEAIDASARRFGIQYERNLLFDSTKRSRFGSHHKYTFSFFEAYREELSSLARLIGNRPQNAHKIDVAVRALREADGIGLGDSNGDGKKDGFMYRDPQTGEERFVVPGSAALGSWLTGIEFGGFSMPTKSMMMTSTILPGVGPAVSFPMSFFIPKSKNWQWLNDLVYPYGRPEERGEPPMAGFAEGKLPRPIWFKRVAPYLSDVGKAAADKIGIESVGDFWSAMITAMADNPKEDQVYRSYYLRVLQSLSTNRPAPSTAKEYKALEDEAERKTNQLYFLRGLGNFVLPGTPVSRFLGKTKLGYVELGVLADVKRKFEDEAEAMGQDRSEGSMRFIDTYGETVWSLFGSLRASKKYQGLVMSKDFEDWFDKNKSLVDTYPAIAGFFGPQKEPGKWGPVEQNVYNRYVSRGYIEPQSAQELINQAQNNVAYTYWDSIRAAIPLGMRDTPQMKQVLAEAKENIKAMFPRWDTQLSGSESKAKREEQIRQLRQIITEPKIAKTDVAVAVQMYLNFRDTEIEKLNRQGVKGWEKGGRSVKMRMDLLALGDGTSKIIPEFKPLWERVLSREFEQPGQE